MPDEDKAQADLWQELARLRSLVENLPAGVVLKQGNWVVINKAVEAMTGYRQDEIGTPEQWFAALYGDRAAVFRASYEANLKTGFPISRLLPIQRKDGETRLVEFAGYGDDQAEVWLLHDVTDRVRAEQALQDAEEWQRTLFNGSLDAIFVADADTGRLVDCNAAAERLVGRSRAELIGQPQAILHPPGAAGPDGLTDIFRLHLQPEGLVTVETQVVTREGQIREVAIKPNLYEYRGRRLLQGVFRDITERKQAEAALLKAFRLEVAATLAGGVAHQVNNLMTGVLGNAELLRAEPGRPDAADLLAAIARSAQRASGLARQMLAFAQSGVPRPQPLDLNRQVAEILELWPQQQALPAGVHLEYRPATDLWPLLADPMQIDQVVVNLLTNAAEALDGDGQIIVATRNVRVGPAGEQPRLRAGTQSLPAGPYVCLEVADTGSGMSPAVQARLFEPFFTTKFQGRGLGLAAAYGIVQNHGGAVMLDSAEGQGTTVRVYLPANGATRETL